MSMCFNRRTLIGFGIGALALVALSAITGRGLLGFLPLLLLLACPLSMVAMMVFGMRGMGRSDNHEASDPQSTADDAGEIARLRAEVAELRNERASALPPPTADTSRR